MNTTRTIASAFAASIFALAASSAFAGGEAEQTQAASSGLTRAQVKAELAQARATGFFKVDETVAQSVDRDVQSARARSEVKAEAVYAARHPKLDRDYVGG